MHHYFNSITNTKGDALIGYFVRCVDATTGLSASLYADTNLTPILSISGVANAAQVNSDGDVDFYIPLGTYHLDIYATDSTTFVRRIQNVPMVDDITPPSAMTIGLFTGAHLLTIGSGATLVQTTGYSVADKGGALYAYDATVDSAYVAANPRSSFLSANLRGFRLSHEQEITPLLFGALADGTTDDSAAFVAALAYLKATANAWQLHGYAGPGAAKLFIPKGIYNIGSTTLDITCGLIMEGEGGSLNGPGSSVLTWTSNVTGIRVQAPNTSGASTTGLSNTYSGDGALLRNFSLDGAWAGGAESEAHGIHIRGHAQVENVFIDRFAGDGIHIAADASGNNGNANNWSVINSQAQRCRNGLYIDGPDSNAGYSIGFSGNSNRRWSIWDSSFLGDLHLAPHSASSGRVGFGDGTTTPVTLVHHLGRLFTPVHGQEATAATTSPPASATDTAYWLFYSAGSIDTGTPDWFSGILIRSGGSYLGEEGAASGIFLNPYSESDGPPAQIFGSWEIKGGAQGAGVPGGDGQYQFAGGAEYNVGYMRGAAADYSYNIGHTNFGYLNFYAYSAAGTVRTRTGGLRAFPGGFMASLFTTEWDYVRNGVTIGLWNASGLNLQTGYTLSVNTVQVVTARKTGWAVDTGTSKRTANATYAAGTTLTYSAAYVQAEQTAMATRMAAVEAALQDATQTIKALKDDLHGSAGHGLIGT